MLFQIITKVTEEAYLDFNYFHSLESPQGKKMLMKIRCMLLAMTALLSLLVVSLSGWNTFAAIFVVFITVFTLIYMLLFKKIMKRNIRKEIERLKKSGKLPYAEDTRLEFYEDHFLDISPDRRTELTYAAIERILVVKDRFVLLYLDSIQANVIPMAQLRKQVDLEDLMRFLSQKCKIVEYY